MTDSDKHFSDSIARFYETYLVPLIFAPYAEDMASRVAAARPSRVLEVACGTGVVTRALASLLPADVEIVATDLNQPMVDHAASIGTARPVEWRQADAMALPFEDASFDAVVCQFAFMFFPDKPHALAEMRRVLRPGGTLFFSVWDRIEDNEFADVVTNAVASLFPDDPPYFLARTPHGHGDVSRIAEAVRLAGFPLPPRIETITARSVAASPYLPALAYCQGTPLRNEIESRDASRLAEATSFAEEAVAQRFGRGEVEGKIQAHVVTVGK